MKLGSCTRSGIGGFRIGSLSSKNTPPRSTIKSSSYTYGLSDNSYSTSIFVSGIGTLVGIEPI